MSEAMPPSMADALRRVRAGDLSGATALIRDLLDPAPATPPSAPPMREAKHAPLSLPASSAGAAAREGRFVEGSHSGAAGTLDYRLYLSSALAPGMPLVVMLHGCTQNPEDFALGTGMNRLAEELGFLVAYPRQTQAANPQRCWNWFRPRDRRRDSGEAALIAGVTRDVIATYTADPARVYVAGLSAGGAAAANMAAAYPDLYAAVGIHSGLASGTGRDVPSALAAMKQGGGAAAGEGTFVPVITIHGDRDTTVAEINSRQIIAAARARAGAALTVRTESATSASGRRFTRDSISDARGVVLIEQWTIHGGGHAWSGGDAAGSYTDPTGPDASRAMLAFFLTHRQARSA